MEKRVNLRVEHVKHSKCRDDFLARVKKNAELKTAAKAAGGEFTRDQFSFDILTSQLLTAVSSLSTEQVVLKRFPAAPRGARTVSTANNVPQTLAPIAYGPSFLLTIARDTDTNVSLSPHRYYDLIVFSLEADFLVSEIEKIRFIHCVHAESSTSSGLLRTEQMSYPTSLSNLV